MNTVPEKSPGFDENSEQQLEFIRKKYGSLSRFLSRKHNEAACVAIYGKRIPIPSDATSDAAKQPTK
jgi:hypothetical protein